MGFFRENLAFHERLFKATRNKFLMEMVNSIEKRVMLHMHREATETRMLKDTNEQIHEMVVAISTGDAVRAAEAFMQHVLFGKQRIVDPLEEQGS